ncbi:hypothetical protein [Reichenbachiella sp.]|uniref:hypothetical protein n=1 Tax=Reichenbachiella sp. TaxID=2184521 RepID=UPI003BB03248
MKKLAFVLTLFVFQFHLVSGQSETKIPTLNGHPFTGLGTMKSPYTNTSFFLELGLGETGVFTTEGVPVGDSTVFNLNGELLFVNLRFGYKQRVKKWISFFFNADYSARLGNSAESIYVSGVNTMITIEPGVSFSILEKEKFVLSGYVKLTNTESSIVDVSGFVEDLFAGKKYASLTRDVPALNGGGGLTGIYAIGPSIAFHVDGQLVYGETLERTPPELQYYIGSNVSLNFQKWLNLPITFTTGGYANTLTNVFSTQGNLTSSFLMKLTYTGSESFALSIESYNGRTPIENTNNRVQLRGVSFSSRFYF